MTEIRRSPNVTSVGDECDTHYGRVRVIEVDAGVWALFFNEKPPTSDWFPFEVFGKLREGEDIGYEL